MKNMYEIEGNSEDIIKNLYSQNKQLDNLIHNSKEIDADMSYAHRIINQIKQNI